MEDTKTTELKSSASLVVTIVLAHPRRNSFNHVLAQTIKEVTIDAGATADILDLYQDGFDPVLSMSELQRKMTTDDLSLEYARKLSKSALVIFLYPLWWGMPPAILTGFLNRILLPGFAFEFLFSDGGFASQNDGLRRPLLQADFLVMYSANEELHKDEILATESIWTKSIAHYMGIQNCQVGYIDRLRKRSRRERTAWIKSVSAQVQAHLLRLDESR